MKIIFIFRYAAFFLALFHLGFVYAQFCEPVLDTEDISRLSVVDSREDAPLYEGNPARASLDREIKDEEERLRDLPAESDEADVLRQSISEKRSALSQLKRDDAASAALSAKSSVARAASWAANSIGNVKLGSIGKLPSKIPSASLGSIGIGDLGSGLGTLSVDGMVDGLGDAISGGVKSALTDALPAPPAFRHTGSDSGDRLSGDIAFDGVRGYDCSGFATEDVLSGVNFYHNGLIGNVLVSSGVVSMAYCFGDCHSEDNWSIESIDSDGIAVIDNEFDEFFALVCVGFG